MCVTWSKCEVVIQWCWNNGLSDLSPVLNANVKPMSLILKELYKVIGRLSGQRRYQGSVTLDARGKIACIPSVEGQGPCVYLWDWAIIIVCMYCTAACTAALYMYVHVQRWVNNSMHHQRNDNIEIRFLLWFWEAVPRVYHYISLIMDGWFVWRYYNGTRVYLTCQWDFLAL